MAATGRSAILITTAAAIVVAQVILPATMDLIGSICLLALGAYGGWSAAKATA